MSDNVVLDTSALVAYARMDPAAAVGVGELLAMAKEGNARVLVSALAWLDAMSEPAVRASPGGYRALLRMPGLPYVTVEPFTFDDAEAALIGKPHEATLAVYHSLCLAEADGGAYATAGHVELAVLVLGDEATILDVTQAG